MRTRRAKRPVEPRWSNWSRVPDADGCMYRLFRREGQPDDVRGPVHARMVYVHKSDPACISARRLRMAYRELREEVDEIDLAMMGVEA